MHIQRRSLLGALAVAAVAAGCSSNSTSGSSASTAGSAVSGGAGGEVGVFTWWADGSEKEGLDAFVELFEEWYPNNTFVNLAVAGGSGSNAKAKLASDLANGNPPGSFQGHAGAELTDYIDNEQIEPVDDMLDELGGSSVFPENLLDRITVGGHVYSIPCDIHRANMIWANSELLTNAGITDEPADVSQWLEHMEAVRNSGISTPLSIGGTWTQTELLESILAAELGSDTYNSLFEADGNWDTDAVRQAITDYNRALDYANTASDGDDWPAATDMVIDGQAAYNVMGDWALAEFTMKDKTYGTDYTAFAVPGDEEIFDFLADSFTMPVGAPNPDGTNDWLRLIGSAEGQKAFNLKKGSIPARTDIEPDEFPEYQQGAMESFKNDKIVSSIAHGAAVSLAWSSEINTAVSAFYQSRDTDALVSALVSAHSRYAV